MKVKRIKEYIIFIVDKVDTKNNRSSDYEYPAEAVYRPGINIDKGGFIPNGRCQKENYR